MEKKKYFLMAYTPPVSTADWGAGAAAAGAGEATTFLGVELGAATVV